MKPTQTLLKSTAITYIKHNDFNNIIKHTQDHRSTKLKYMVYPWKP